MDARSQEATKRSLSGTTARRDQWRIHFHLCSSIRDEHAITLDVSQHNASVALHLL